MPLQLSHEVVVGPIFMSTSYPLPYPYTSLPSSSLSLPYDQGYNNSSASSSLPMVTSISIFVETMCRAIFTVMIYHVRNSIHQSTIIT